MRPSTYRIRAFEPRDAERLVTIYVRSVREVASVAYDAAQIEAWIPEPPDAAKLLPYMIAFYTYVAVDEHDQPHAWIAMRSDGYIDMLFALPAAIGTGAAADLYATVERIATEIGLDRMSAHASRFAEPFFTKRGWRVDKRGVDVKRGVEIPRAEMSKPLYRSCGSCLTDA